MAEDRKPTEPQGLGGPAAKTPSRRGPAWLLDNPPPGMRLREIVDLDAFNVAVLAPEDPADSAEALHAELLGPSDDDGLLPLAPLPDPGGYDYTVLGPAAEATRSAADAIRALHRRSASAWLAIGVHLLTVKAALRHGEFTRWCKAEFAWSPRTARAMMRGAIQLQMMKTAEFAELAPPVVVALARAPRAVLEHVRKEPADARRTLTVERVAELCAAHPPHAKSAKKRAAPEPAKFVADRGAGEPVRCIADNARTEGIHGSILSSLVFLIEWCWREHRDGALNILRHLGSSDRDALAVVKAQLASRNKHHIIAAVEEIEQTPSRW